MLFRSGLPRGRDWGRRAPQLPPRSPSPPWSPRAAGVPELGNLEEIASVWETSRRLPRNRDVQGASGPLRRTTRVPATAPLTPALGALSPPVTDPRSPQRRSTARLAPGLLALALSGLAVPSAAQEPRREQDLSALEGRPAPALDVTGWLNTDGPLTWADLRGKVVLIDFWGTW